MFKKEDLTYYQNPTGLIAVSYNQGETIILPSGKEMEITQFWEELSDDLFESLNDVQTRILKGEWDKNGDDIGQIARRFRINKNKEDTANGNNKPPVHRKLSDNVLVVVADFD